MPELKSPAGFAVWAFGVFVFATIACLGWHFGDRIWAVF